jgi:peroxiredoxin
MSNEKKLAALRRETSPLFNDRKIKLGTFSGDLSCGCAVMSWPRYEEGMRQFKAVTIPALKQAGLR